MEKSAAPSFTISAANWGRKRPKSPRPPLPPSPRHNNSIGSLGEQIAVSYLRKRRFRIVERNFRIRYGEIDIVAYEDTTLVFVEVKTRSSNAYGTPLESVSRRKRIDLMRAIDVYRTKVPATTPVRIDVVAVTLVPGSRAVSSVEHIRNITAGEGVLI